MDKTLKRARLAVLAAFFINGAAMATWVSRIPAMQAKLSLSEGALGLVLMGLSTGVLSALFLAGGLIARFSSAKATVGAGIVMSLSLIPLAWANSPVILWITLFIVGAGTSLMDVSMNDQAVLVERQAGRPLMSSFHATYSIGGLAGALAGAGMAATEFFTPAIHFALVGALLAATLIYCYRLYIHIQPEKTAGGPVFRLPERALWMLGVIAFCTALAEGSMADWSAVYLNQVLSTTTSMAALGFAGFSATMTLGRLLGDRLIARFHAEKLVRVGGLIATAGFVIVILTKSPALAIAGFALIGAGVANIIPLAYSVAGNFPGVSSSAGIAGVATIGYAGFLAGPPVIGIVAEGTSLRVAFILVAVLAASLIFTAKSASPQAPAAGALAAEPEV